RFRAAVVSIVIFVSYIPAWHLATRGTGTAANMSPEHAKLMGLTATHGKSAMPEPPDVATKLWEHLRQQLHGNGPNDKGLGINVAPRLDVGTFRRAFDVLRPAAAPTIPTGMRISVGMACRVTVAAEVLVGGTGSGYLVWKEWSNLSITSVIIAILLTGLPGM